jgi:hypothetical protein
MTCSNCNNNFDKDALTKWCKHNDTCPCCRSQWTDYTEYINDIDIFKVYKNIKSLKYHKNDDLFKLRYNQQLFDYKPPVKVFNKKNKHFTNRR